MKITTELHTSEWLEHVIYALVPFESTKILNSYPNILHLSNTQIFEVPTPWAFKKERLVQHKTDEDYSFELVGARGHDGIYKQILKITTQGTDGNNLTIYECKPLDR